MEKIKELWRRLTRPATAARGAAGWRGALRDHAVIVAISGALLGGFLIVFLMDGSSEDEGWGFAWKAPTGGSFSSQHNDDPRRTRTLIDAAHAGAGNRRGRPIAGPNLPDPDRARRELPEIQAYQSGFDDDAGQPGAGEAGAGRGALKKTAGFGEREGGSSSADLGLAAAGPARAGAPGADSAHAPAAASAAPTRGLLARLSARVRSTANRILGGGPRGTMAALGRSAGEGPGFAPGGGTSNFSASGNRIAPGGPGVGGSGGPSGGAPSAIGGGGKPGGGDGGGGTGGGGPREEGKPKSPGEGGEGGGGYGGGLAFEDPAQAPVCKKAGETRCTVYHCAEKTAKESSTKLHAIAEQARRFQLALLDEVKTGVASAAEKQGQLSESAAKLQYPCAKCEGLHYCRDWARNEARAIAELLREEARLIEQSRACADALPDPTSPGSRVVLHEPKDDCFEHALLAIDKERAALESIVQKRSHARGQFDKCLESVPRELDGKPYELGEKARNDFKRFSDWYLQNQEAIAAYLGESWCLRHPERCDSTALLAALQKFDEESDLKALLEELSAEAPADIVSLGKEVSTELEAAVPRYQNPQGEDSRSVVRGARAMRRADERLALVPPLWREPVEKECGAEDPDKPDPTRAAGDESGGWRGPGPRGGKNGDEGPRDRRY